MKSCLKNIFAAIFMAAVIVFAYLTVYQKGNSGAEESELINIFLFALVPAFLCAWFMRRAFRRYGVWRISKALTAKSAQ
ncbi:MAG: hypothetical protein R3B69_00750 [Candidatus Paceibacterota bacterium]